MKLLPQGYCKRKGGAKIAAGARHFDIPRSSLRGHIMRLTLTRKRGPSSILSPSEEKQVVDFLFQLQHPLNITELKLKVAEIIQGHVTPFKEGFFTQRRYETRIEKPTSII